MTFVAGAVTAILGAKVNPAGFASYDASMRRAIMAATRGEAAQARYNTELARSQATMARVGAVARTGLAAGVLGAGAAIAKSIKLAADFEQQLDALGAVSGASERQMAKLRKSAMDMGAATKYSALEAAGAQTELAKGGLSVTKILNGGLKGALALAAAGEMDLAQAAATTANALNLFKLNGSEAGHVADALATAANATTADVSDFALALTQGGAAAKAAGLSFDQTVVYLEAMAQAGVKGSDAGTSMKAALTQIAKPTKQSAEMMKRLNLEFFDAQGKIKPLPAIAKNLDEAFGGLTEQQRLQAAATIAGTDGMRGLLALYDSSPAALRKLSDGVKEQGTAAEVAAEKQDNLKGKMEQFRGALETAGIALGTTLLPALTDGVERATEVLTEAIESGDFERWGQDILSGGRTALEVIGDLAEVVGDVADAAGDVVGPVVQVADALGLFTPTGIEATLAALLGFRAARTLAPMVGALAAQVQLLGTAPTKRALAGDLLGMIGPARGAALGIGALAGVLVLAASRQDGAAAAAQRHASALREVKDALDALEGKTADDAAATNDAAEADKRAADARNQYTDAVEKHGKTSPQAREAQKILTRETIAAAQAQTRARDAQKSRREEAEKAITTARKEHAAARQRVEALTGPVKVSPGRNMPSPQVRENQRPQAGKELAEAQRELARANAEVTLSEINKQRMLAGSEPINRRNAMSTARLSDALKGVPKDVKTKILTEGTPKALSQLSQIMERVKGTPDEKRIRAILAGDAPVKVKLAAIAALAKGVPDAKIQAILSNGESTKNQLRDIAAAVNAIPSFKSITIAAHGAFDATARKLQKLGLMAEGGRGDGMALVGEGRNPREAVVDTKTGNVMVTSGPTLMNLPDTAYVIPEDPAYRGRAMGLLAMLAGDLGLKGFAKGKAAKKSAGKMGASVGHTLGRPVPSKLQPTNLPVDEWEGKITAAEAARDRIASKRSRLLGERDERGKDKKLTKKAKQARAELPAVNQELRDRKRVVAELRKELSRAKRWQKEITALETRADTEATRMANANRTGDAGGYNSAKASRVKILTRLRELLGATQAAFKGQAGLDAQGRFEEVVGQLQEAQTSTADASDETYSAAERARLGALDRDVALAALTVGLEDDTAAATAREQFLSGLLTQAVGAGRSDAVVTELAEAVASARSNVQSLTGQGSNDNQDLQAQIEQQRARADREAENNRINASALSAFVRSGDIGFGRNQSITVNTLHPGDPRVMEAIAGAAASGFGYQRPVESPRLSVG